MYREGHDTDCSVNNGEIVCNCGYDLWRSVQIDLLHEAGCTCPSPLLGYKTNVGPRCRLCGTVAKDKMTQEESDAFDKELGDDLYLFILDTICEKCNFWYGMIEYHPTSTCPKCGHVQEN
jgi:hypothetical protein